MDELHRVFGATRLGDGTIALVNGGTHEVRFFGGDGKFIRASGREGQGPGEFSDAFYIHWLPGETLYVGDYRPFQFLVIAPDGRWVRTVRPTPVYPNNPATMERAGRRPNDARTGRIVPAFVPRTQRTKTQSPTTPHSTPTDPTPATTRGTSAHS